MFLAPLQGDGRHRLPSPDKFTPAFCLNILFHSHLPTTTHHPLPPEPPPALKMASGHDLTFVWFLNLLFNKRERGGVCVVVSACSLYLSWQKLWESIPVSASVTRPGCGVDDVCWVACLHLMLHKTFVSGPRNGFRHSAPTRTC